MDLGTLWFWLLGVLLAGYAVLDGFDLGVGILHPLAKSDEDRNVLVKTIGPLWDGNEVWLVTFGGALFAAFPEAYATAFSGFYVPFMLLLFALIFRAVSVEFRHKFAHRRWRRVCDWGFTLSSSLAALLFGTAVGASIDGVPLNARGIFVGSLVDELSPYALLIGGLAVAAFALHGAMFLRLKTIGELRERITRWAWGCYWIYLAAFLLATGLTLAFVPHATRNFQGFPWAGLVVVLNLLALANVPRCLMRDRPREGFLSSGGTIAALVFLFGVALYPNMIVSNPNPAHSLTIENAASSDSTLALMAGIAAIGLPFIAAYTFIVYWTFRGPVTPEDAATHH
ncbi:cytochrome d ubiquinol oxidase subunit II [Alienimonas californiensis]|uniref:Cytochrome bd-I ubiquinol oxidase subunit 2 n=1 Tax=Alienimonas californiensis TaxID=2527989 RepID=A0A517P5S0_9PLAN|nr:cytochrome d ubiquinol oxidase subunit II [Alienimonas californiensis]QDT14712.1 Cytochrome bd-I ubiquinol oxidase subunit 2 [Alienimonas californiensis]